MGKGHLCFYASTLIMHSPRELRVASMSVDGSLTTAIGCCIQDVLFRIPHSSGLSGMDLFNCFEPDLQMLRIASASKSINMKGGLSFTATTSRLQLAYASLVGGQMLTLPVSSYMLHMRKRGILPRLPVNCKSIHNFLSGQEIQSQSFDKMTLGISWYSVSPYFSRRMSPGASNAAPQCSENLCGCCRFLSCQELYHDLPQIFRSRQARDGSKVDDLDMFGALGRFTMFRC